MPGNRIRTDTGEISTNKVSSSTFLSGANVTYSGAYGSAAVRLDSTFSSATGGFHNIYSIVNTDGAIATDGHGVVGIKSVVRNTAALSDGEVFGGQFIAKHDHATNAMLNAASLIGIEAWAVVSKAGVAGTCIGGNFGWHNQAAGGSYPAGTVIRGIQIFCDNQAGAPVPIESSGLCIWNMAGAITNAINVVESGDGFTFFAKITDGDVCAKSTETNGGSQSGWIKVQIGTATRYIKLWDTGPS